MSDPIGLVGGQGAQGPRPGGVSPRAGTDGAQGAAFKEMLLENLRQANQLEQDATRAVEDLMAGRRRDVEGVALATQKADTAFKALQAVRNKVLEAFEEVKQMRA